MWGCNYLPLSLWYELFLLKSKLGRNGVGPFASFFRALSCPLIFGCIYCTKLEPISKIGNVARAPRMVALNKSYAPRKPRHRLASLGNPQKEKMFLALFIFAGVIFLKWKGHFSFWGSAFQVFRQCGGASMWTRFCENYFLGIGFSQNRD